MAWEAAVLIVISAVFHTGWNILAKKYMADAAFFCVAMAATVFLFLPFIPYFMPLIKATPLFSRGLILLAGVFQAAYFFFLGKAYDHGEISVVYPIARSYPILVVMGVLALYGKRPNLWGVVGVVLIVAGCFVVQLRRFTEFKLQRFLQLAALFAFLAAVASAGYSICDKTNVTALQDLNTERSLGLSVLFIPFFYEWQLNVMLTFFMGLISLFHGTSVKHSLLTNWWKAPAVGVISFAAYGLVLLAMKFVDNVSYVVAFRQISILFTVVVGIMFLKERFYPPKIAGAVITMIGLILVKLFGS